MSSLKDNVREFFTFHKHERKGLILFLILLGGVIFAPRFIKDRIAVSDDGDEVFVQQAMAFELALKESQSKGSIKQNRQAPELEPRSFDPNTVSSEALIEMGLSRSLASRIVNYRKAGGRYRQAKDLGRVYGMDPEVLDRLIPFMRILESDEKRPLVGAKSVKKKTPVLVNLNRSTIDDWQKIRGIGPAYANRIVSYRERLGGFHHIGQLKEIYGLSDSLYHAILPFVNTMDVGAVDKININSITFDQLKQHPYFRNYRLNRSMLRYREVNGPFEQIEDLRRLHLMTDSIYEKIKPYLVVYDGPSGRDSLNN